MTTAQIGVNCHITLTHPDVNEGDPTGFILRQEGSQLPAVAIQRERSSNGDEEIHVFFEILLAEELMAPNGAPCPWTKAEMYAHLVNFLAVSDGIVLGFGGGVLSSLGALGHASTELHYPDHCRVSCQFSCVGAYFPPVPLADYQASLWDGLRTWATAYWR